MKPSSGGRGVRGGAVTAKGEVPWAIWNGCTIPNYEEVDWLMFLDPTALTISTRTASMSFVPIGNVSRTTISKCTTADGPSNY